MNALRKGVVAVAVIALVVGAFLAGATLYPKVITKTSTTTLAIFTVTHFQTIDTHGREWFVLQAYPYCIDTVLQIRSGLGCGSVTVSTGWNSGIVPIYTRINLTASPFSGYHFIEWCLTSADNACPSMIVRANTISGLGNLNPMNYTVISDSYIYAIIGRNSP